MCTHFDLHSKDVGQLLKDGNNISTESWINEGGFTPLYNVRRSSAVPIIRRLDPASVPNLSSMQWDAYRDSPLVLETMTWGIERTTVNDTVKMNITAKAETVLAKNVQYWDSLKGVGRCVVPCNGYYDIPPKSTKALPSYVRRGDSNLFLLAGLHSTATIHGMWETSQTFAIVMAPADPGTSQEHQPVILGSSEAARLWLNDGPSSWGLGHCDLATAHHNPSIPPLTKYTVPEGVKNAGVECPSFVNPIRNRPDGMAAFLKKGPSQSQVPVASTSNAPATMSTPPASPSKPLTAGTLRSFPTPVKGKRASKSRNPPLRSPTHSIAGSDDGTPADAGDASNPIVLDDSSEGEEESTYGDASNPIILDDSEAGEEESTYGVESVSSPADGGFDFATADDSSEEEYTSDDEGELPVA
ncbi:hypothetical protein DFP72DRAFT_817196 [Ephemerocybe angulata]|uniref:Uncharacterized protein n=1 Tax=Ephemerocybe angulata TaxID=980116 RepID=A0A8H6HPN6_9AGAR|nr:hypothetical protein DFP72DRAFT_817196 [Tulosesus angulatus]